MRLKNAIKLMVRPEIYSPTDTDRYIVSFPRSGNTWLRTISFCTRFDREPRSLRELDFGIPDIHFPISRKSLLGNGPQVVKSHNPFRLGARHQTVLYIIRDPRDVLPSYYRYATRASGLDQEFTEFCKASLSGGYWPCSWFEHITSWSSMAPDHVNWFRIVRYEDIVSTNPTALRTLAEFLHDDPVKVEKIVRSTSIEKMTRLELSGRRDGKAHDTSQWFIGKGRASNIQKETVDSVIRKEYSHYLAVMERHEYT